MGATYTQRGKTIKEYRRDAVRVAKDLHYGDEVIRKIKNAKTENEIYKILKTARSKATESDWNRGNI